MNSKPKVLIVDDMPENIQILMTMLMEDYAIIGATTSEKALALSKKEPYPDMILLDILMPEMNGYEICKILKDDPATKTIPIIFITGLSGIEDEAKGLDLGAVDYITKPFSRCLVKSRIRNHIELKRHRDHLQELVDKRTLQLKIAKEATIEAMGIVAENRDPETGGHIQRTKNYVKIMAQKLAEMDYSPELKNPLTLELLHISAPLHDIGKVAISDTILLKPGKLTDEEFEIIKMHTIYGEETILEAQKRLGEDEFLNIAREIAGSHHEKWDGTGYPRGLKGNDIPVSGRIMAIADVYDALISKRTYKPAFPQEKVIEIIRGESGKQFDPIVIDTFMVLKDVFLEIAHTFSD